MCRSQSPSDFFHLSTFSATADPGSIAVRANFKRKKVSTQMREFLRQKGNTVI